MKDYGVAVAGGGLRIVDCASVPKMEHAVAEGLRAQFAHARLLDDSEDHCKDG
jgi:hypothetical protein